MLLIRAEDGERGPRTRAAVGGAERGQLGTLQAFRCRNAGGVLAMKLDPRAIEIRRDWRTDATDDRGDAGREQCPCDLLSTGGDT